MKKIIPLQQRNLDILASRLPVPNYPRKNAKIGIVHVGVGGFHRAHQAYYLHQLRQLGEASDWGICGIGIREPDLNLYNILQKQDHLYTLLIKHPNGKMQAEVIGSLVDFEMGNSNPEPVIARMASADTRIVSLTITEGGYNFNPITRKFNFDNPDIQQELKQPKAPKSIYGFLCAALKRRRDQGLPAFTILSCDNIEHNGDMVRKMLLSFAHKQDPDLATWIAEAVGFPNSMVDRITPVTSKMDVDILAQNYGVRDEWPVTCEPFIQWVVEDKFSNGRPAFENVGVQFVPDVGPYEKMKLRLLNAGHSVLGLLGAIRGYSTINACMEDHHFVTYLKAFLDREATPVLGKVEGVDLTEYKNSLLERFANPNIKDSLSRICSESSAKLPKFLIATIHENLGIGGNIKLATLVIAAWCYYSDKERDQNGQTLEIIDAMHGELHQAASETKNNALAFIQQVNIFGELSKNKIFTETYTSMLQELYEEKDIVSLMQRAIDLR